MFQKLWCHNFSFKWQLTQLGLKNIWSASLQRGKTHPECPRYDIKPSDDVAPALEIWGMWCTPLLPLLPGPLRSGVVAPDRVLSMGQIELFDYLNWVQTNHWCLIELLVIHSNTWNHSTVCKWIVLNRNTCKLFTVCKQMIDIE